MLVNISRYVAIAFEQAGDLVKKLHITEEVRGAFIPATGKYASSSKTFIAEALDNDEDEDYKAGSLANKRIRSYIIKSDTVLNIGQKFVDDNITFTIFRLNPVQQNSVIFIYIMWADA